MRFLEVEPGHNLPLPAEGPFPDAVHVFDERTIRAVNAALAARRPLLIRGEPGIGKSQVARAVAVALGRAYVQHVLDARTEARDLMWQFDAVDRLAVAQIAGTLHDTKEAVRDELAIKNFVQPGVLWWAFDWDTASGANGGKEPRQPEGCDWNNGTVVLVDEIDKAESDVPNGLLEALGAGEFTPRGHDAVRATADVPPLVVITTNEERAMPDAFLRRCLIMHLNMPTDRDDLCDWLVDRGRAHFPDLSDDVLEAAAGQVADDRDMAEREQRLPLPGQAEYLDLLRALDGIAPGNSAKQEALIAELAEFVVAKNLSTGPAA